MGVSENLYKVPVMILVVLFGTGSWVAINGLWVELPLLVTLGIPEGYNLASYLVIIIQIANIGPLIFTITSYFLKEKDIEVPATYIVLPIGVLACLLLAFFWDVTTIVGGVLHSTPLLVLSFFVAIVDCTSSVAFTPFMARFKSNYLTWYFVGEGFSALLPSLVALGQGVGKEACVSNYTYINETSGQTCNMWMSETLPANFPPDNFFFFLFSMMLISLISFFLLNTLPLAKREYAPEKLTLTASNSTPSFDESHQMSSAVKDSDQNKSKPEEQEPDADDHPPSKQRRSTASFVYLFVLLGYVNALSNGVLPSIQSYSCGAYGAQAYLLAATLGNVANPVFAFIVLLFPQKSLIVIAVTAFIGTAAGAYEMATATLSPTPPLQGEMAGTVLVVLAWIISSGFFTYTKATIGWILRNEPDNRNLLIGFGAVTQVGSLIGACIMFPLVNVYYLFTGYYGSPCDGYVACES